MLEDLHLSLNSMEIQIQFQIIQKMKISGFQLSSQICWKKLRQGILNQTFTLQHKELRHLAQESSLHTGQKWPKRDFTMMMHLLLGPYIEYSEIYCQFCPQCALSLLTICLLLCMKNLQQRQMYFLNLQYLTLNHGPT